MNALISLGTVRPRGQRGRNDRRDGVTLVELLVTVGIISLLVGLILPAVQAAREASRRAACVHNLRQLMLAAHAYAATWDGMPPSLTGGQLARGIGNSFSLHCRLLPYLDLQPLYASINFGLPGVTLPMIAPGNASVLDIKIATFLCPSDPAADANGGAVSYRINVGPCSDCPDTRTGAFVSFRATRFAEYADGTSNTLAFSEKPIGSGRSASSAFRDWAMYEGLLERKDPADAWRSACAAQRSARRVWATDGGGSWLLGGAIYTAFFVAGPPNDPIPDCGKMSFVGTGLFSARSYHPGGVNAAMADGSVRWCESSINLAAWRAMGSRAGGEIVDPR
ncbi:DUF1559 family PulG-like putative transporter [Paludisphaera rhizosphaerae]|uniref:DUF1559 family PulG-like putative transporter n=1 Tax=Paludisphaera rhizosphaerae TaxID=2711216 RepID=UPI0013EC90A0|nr:DUF1559 domain-containing protein [Paludisphaera rhizosphaerae]